MLHLLRDFLMAYRKCDDSVIAYKLNDIAMIFPFRVQVAVPAITLIP